MLKIAGEEPAHENIILPKWEPPCLALSEYENKRKPTTPCEFFSFNFPKAVQKFGSVVLECRQVFKDGTLKIIPVAVNEDAIAAILGSKQFGDTVYHKFEMQFYCRDHATGWFNPADVEDLKLMLSQLFLNCIEALPGCVDPNPLFNEFRSDEVLDRIIRRAKAVLGVGDEFFSAEGPNARNPATTPKETVRMFVDQCLAEDPPSVLTVKDAFDAYTGFCKARQLPQIHLNQFKVSAAPHINRRFGKGVRNDLDRYGGDRCLGWRGLKLRPSMAQTEPVAA